MDKLPTRPFALPERPGIGSPALAVLLRSKAKSGALFLALLELLGDRVVCANKNKSDSRSRHC